MTLALAAALLLAPLQPPAEPPPPPASAAAAGPSDPAARIAAQRDAMRALAFLDGAWRGGAEAADGAADFVQTERVGALLGDTIRIVEGRGYDGSGATVFNALGIISYDPVARTYSIRSYATGYAGDYPLTVRPDGFSWSHPAGPGATMRYTATVRGDEWHEIGERVSQGAPPARMFEMRLRRVGDTQWPGGDAVAPR